MVRVNEQTGREWRWQQSLVENEGRPLSLRGRAVNINPAQPWEPTLLHPNPPTYIPCQQPSIYHIASNTPPPPPCRGSSHASVGLRRKEWRNGAFMEIRLLSTIFPIRYGNISRLATPHARPSPNICSPYSDFSPDFGAVCSIQI